MSVQTGTPGQAACNRQRSTIRTSGRGNQWRKAIATFLGDGNPASGKRKILWIDSDLQLVRGKKFYVACGLPGSLLPNDITSKRIYEVSHNTVAAVDQGLRCLIAGNHDAVRIHFPENTRLGMPHPATVWLWVNREGQVYCHATGLVRREFDSDADELTFTPMD